MPALGNVDRKTTGFAFGNEPLGRIETGEIVKQPRQACLSRIGAVPLREEVGTTCDPHTVRVSVPLSQLFFNPTYQLCKRGHQSPKPARRAPSLLR
jgi:hypothetical protein